MSTFEIIKKLAKEKHMSLSEVNSKAGLGTNTIYSWKTSVPSLENAQKVAKVLHTSADYLLGNTDDPAPAAYKDKVFTESDIENPKIKMLARKMDSKKLNDSQIDSISKAISSFIDSMFEDKDDDK